MRYLELLVTDMADDTCPEIRTEWIHRDHIETIRPYIPNLPDLEEPAMLWLELSLTAGRFRYVPVRPTRPEDADDAARIAIAVLLEGGSQPVRAIADDDGCAAESSGLDEPGDETLPGT